MSANIKILKERNGDIVYPQTKISAIYNNSNVSLQSIIDDIEDDLDESLLEDNSELPSPSSSSPLDADQLDGHPSSYYLNTGNVVNNLTSTSTTDVLSANQGRLLNNGLTTINSTVSGLTTRVGNIETSITGIDSDLDSLDSSVSSINTSISSINTTISGLNTNKAPKANPSFTGVATVANGDDYTTAKLRNIIISTSEPSNSVGGNGDIWIVYEE